MKKDIKEKLLSIAAKKIKSEDPSHDIHHAHRVLAMAEKLAKAEKADHDIVFPAALFHDVIVYQKNDPRGKNETNESAELAGKILKSIPSYPKNKIEKVKTAIRECSFSKGIMPDSIEGKILQDADRLEATGAISIMRTFSSGGQMKKRFYDPIDPFREKSEPGVSGAPALDLFYRRLLVVEKTMHTKLAKKIANRRTKFLHDFLNEFKKELKELEQ